MTQTDQSFSERLFSYGTLQLEQVQLATFGRKLDGAADEMPGFSLTMLKIDDPEVVKTSGKTHHPVVAYTGNPVDRVAGAVFAITAQELAHADDYEVAAYRRDRVTLASGVSAWVYVDASTPRQP
ncbi:gamma-glutamylcyclotransferase family protein [Paraburkholderia sp. Ac-20347]|uniref:gamma-glutamylcyclotransferase family protein n=1 Tax=Paraburkholderia sp. Ac-20347 TaxID=2703892 RepID=UPI001982064F|nr:gamma-glutamylcyclotransferase family protein [Paraburkholderia sp. Ac-20347]MBN3808947.1 gamma-glutamylcyclotransferase [Paraburkholderia sp. Ac-20347]